MGIVGGLVFIGALIAFVLVPRQATRVAVSVTAKLEERPDSARSVAVREKAAAEIASADSMLALARRTVIAPPVAVVDTFPPEVVAQRQVLAEEVTTLNRLIDRADNAPLPSSYRALASTPSMAREPGVQVLLDSLTDIEKERDAFGTVGGVDPVYVSLTSPATAVGRTIQSIAEARRARARSELALLRPATPPPVAQTRVDTARYLAQRTGSQQAYVGAVRSLAQIRATNERIDRESSRARDLANVGAPPLAMLAAAFVLALSIGFATSFIYELRRPTIADVREAEQVTGVRVLTIVQPTEVMAERSRRQADVSGPPLIDVVSESYRRLYLHLAATEANIPIVTVAGDDAAIVATVAANVAAAAAFEARSTLLVDVDPTSSTIANIFKIKSNPGLAGIIAGTADWASAIRQTVIGRDRTLDILPSGTRRTGAPPKDVAERIRQDFARMERRYDLIVIAAPTAYVLGGSGSIIPGPDVVLCARVAHTRIVHLRETVEQLRALDLRIHGLVLWDDDSPVIEAQEETERGVRSDATAHDLVETR
jgi:Mrp family chromosome partitioning ATPase